MQIKTILNRIKKQPGFIYDACKWRAAPEMLALEITLRPQSRQLAICSGCGQRRPGYDTLRQRSFEWFNGLAAHRQSWFQPLLLTDGVIPFQIGDLQGSPWDWPAESSFPWWQPYAGGEQL